MDEILNFSVDHRTVTVQITQNPDVFVKVNVEQVATLMRRLTTLRQQMQPPVPTQFTQKGSYLGTASPAWAVEKSSSGSGILLHIREPSIDWLHFQLQPNEARRLGELLIASAEEVPKPPIN